MGCSKWNTKWPVIVWLNQIHWNFLGMEIVPENSPDFNFSPLSLSTKQLLKFKGANPKVCANRGCSPWCSQSWGLELSSGIMKMVCYGASMWDPCFMPIAPDFCQHFHFWAQTVHRDQPTLSQLWNILQSSGWIQKLSPDVLFWMVGGRTL